MVQFALHALTVPTSHLKATIRPRPFPSITCVAGLWGNAVEEITYPTEDMNA